MKNGLEQHPGKVRVFNDPSADWQRFGETEPYWAVLTEETYRRTLISPESLDNFFRSGAVHLEKTWETITTTLDGEFSPHRALDFGCGVGRVLIPLARRCAAVGTDVATSMLDEARRNLNERSLTAELVVADDTLSRLGGSFDFIHSYIVFQHIPPSRGEAIAGRLLDRLEAGGVAALHFTYRTPLAFLQRFTRWARLSVPFAALAANLLRGRPARNPYMQVYEYDLGRLFDLFRGAGCDRIHIELTDHGGVLGAIFYCRTPARAADR